LRLDLKGFTEEEIAFNKLEYQIYYAQKNLKATIKKTMELLGVYGFTTKEIEMLIDNKIRSEPL